MKNLLSIKSIFAFTVFAILVAFGAIGMTESIDVIASLDSITDASILSTIPIWFVVKGENKEFKSLSDDELDALSGEDLMAYTNAKYKNMEGTLMKLVEENKEDNSKNVKEIASIKDEMIENNKMQFGILKQHGELLAQVNVTGGKADEPITLSKAIEGFIKDNLKQIKAVISGDQKKIDISVKVVVQTTAISGSTASIRIPGIGQDPVRRIFISSLFPQSTVGTDSGGLITYWDQNTLNRNANNVAENTAIPESEIDWIEKSCKIEKIGDSIPVTEEAMEDFSFIESEVRNFLLVNVDLKLDQQLLFGTGVSPQLKSINLAAQTYVVGAFSLVIQDPTIFDVMKTAKTQIENSGQNNMFNPNIVLMNPTDETLMKLSKDADGNYLLPMFMTTDGAIVDGMRVITTPLVVQNTMFVMDTTWGSVWNHRDLTLTMATQHADDFLNDRIRLKATLRKAFVIRDIHANAFLKVDSITAAITALTKP